jgi:UDP-N-acetylglucosamine:LPS N-acetylglucosamine transferase
MGHITRDLAIAREIHRQNPEWELHWLVHPIAAMLLKDTGENVLPESKLSTDYTSIAETFYQDFKLNLIKYILATRKAYQKNTELFNQVIGKRTYDLVIGDESYEIIFAMCEGRIQNHPPFIIVHDFIGIDSVKRNLLSKLFINIRNRRWSMFTRLPEVTQFFIGELEDIPDKAFGIGLPNRREWARKHCRILGNVVRFDPAEYADRAQIRKKLGYGSKPLVVCALGGSLAGHEMLTLCGRAFPLVRKEIPRLKMVFICGPSLDMKSLHVPDEIEVRGYVPDLYEHFAASDLAVVVGGGTSTIELVALNRPFLYFPLEEQFDQQINIAGRLERLGAGVKMRYFQTTPESLAEQILANLGKEVSYPQVPIDGARKAAQYISELTDSDIK